MDWQKLISVEVSIRQECRNQGGLGEGGGGLRVPQRITNYSLGLVPTNSKLFVGKVPTDIKLFVGSGPDEQPHPFKILGYIGPCGMTNDTM